jgi:hypothetical protein
MIFFSNLLISFCVFVNLLIIGFHAKDSNNISVVGLSCLFYSAGFYFL